MGPLSKLERDEKAEFDRNIVAEEKNREEGNGDQGNKRKAEESHEDCEKRMFHKKQVVSFNVQQIYLFNKLIAHSRFYHARSINSLSPSW